MKTYIRNLVTETRKNEIGRSLALITLAFTIMFGGLALGTILSGENVPVFPNFALPIFFGTLTLLHILLRPFVVAHFRKNK